MIVQSIAALVLCASFLTSAWRIYQPNELPLTPHGRAVSSLIATLLWTGLLIGGGFFG